MTGYSDRTRQNGGSVRIANQPDRTPDESDMRKGGLAGQLIFSDALPAEIMRAG
jgi:hypothetical protein